MKTFKLTLLSAVVLVLHACAFFSKGEVTTRRYYSPDLPPSSAPGPVLRSSAELRLGRITAGASIAERMMFRESTHEVGFYDDRIWTEKPDSYLRRGLTRVLFEELGLRSVMSGSAPNLDVELIRFEEVLAPTHVARVKIAFSLSDDRVVALQQTLTVERAIELGSDDREGAAVAAAMGEALREAITDLSGRVVSELARAQQQSQQRGLAAP